jgi:hypothetical protein
MFSPRATRARHRSAPAHAGDVAPKARSHMPHKKAKLPNEPICEQVATAQPLVTTRVTSPVDSFPRCLGGWHAHACVSMFSASTLPTCKHGHASVDHATRQTPDYAIRPPAPSLPRCPAASLPRCLVAFLPRCPVASLPRCLLAFSPPTAASDSSYGPSWIAGACGPWSRP